MFQYAGLRCSSSRAFIKARNGSCSSRMTAAVVADATSMNDRGYDEIGDSSSLESFACLEPIIHQRVGEWTLFEAR
jgi:hypothetical protein